MSEKLTVIFVGERYGEIDWNESLTSRTRFQAFKLPNMDALIGHAKQRKFDLVFLSVTSATLAEAQKFTLLRKETAENCPPVVLCINELLDKTVYEKALNLGFNGVLVHPYELPAVDRLVGQALGIKARENVRVCFRLTLEGSSSAQSSLCTTVDISQKGALVLSPKRFPLETPLDIKAMGVEELKEFNCQAKIVREGQRKGGQHQYGLKFEFPSAAAETLWQEFLAALV